MKDNLSNELAAKKGHFSGPAHLAYNVKWVVAFLNTLVSV